MIIWDRNSQYRTKLSPEEREDIALNISTPRSIKKARKINDVINFVAPILVFWAFGLNLIAFAISFIIFDIVLCFIDQMTYVIIPYNRTKNMSLDDVKKRIDSLKKEKQEISEELDNFRKKVCNECRYHYYDNCTDCRDVKLAISEIRTLNDFIKSEENYLNKELEKIKEKEVEANNKTSKDYSDKKQYLIDIRDKLKYYKNKKNMTFLEPVLRSVKLLISTLDKKPMGYALVSNTLYIYLDELQKILEKLTSLDETKKDVYIKDIEKISVALSENINSLINRISKLETEDIEVSITVLLNELTREGEEKNV